MSAKDRELIGNYEVVADEAVTRREVLLMGAVAATGLATASAGIAEAAPAAKAGSKSADGPYVAKDFGYLAKKKMPGLSADQITQHLKLYKGYVSKSNMIRKKLKDAKLEGANTTYAPFRELLVEESYALNGVIYHEYYFGNLGGGGGEPKGELKSALESAYGSTGKFVDFLKAAGKAARGWVVVGWNTRIGELGAYALDLHNMWVPQNVVPVLVLDVYEHAYMVDYGINRGKYLDAFVDNLDWAVVGKRLTRARKDKSGADTTA